ncbi:Peroxiredoxin-5, mitochondrial [Balamuthia mandrillaris]
MSEQLKVGDKIPEVTFLTLKDGAPAPVTTSEIFGGKKVALFAVPGAFTPGCSKKHCPSFVLNAAQLKAKGIETVACTAVNDCFVMDAWCKAQNGEGKLTMLADGDGAFARACGLTKETGNFGGVRSQRYALIATDGVVDYIAVDQQGVEHSTAESLLAHL